MPHPTGRQYQTAVQNPARAFSDQDLAQASAECYANGMPRPYPGGFATTFLMRGRGAEWAVRCFTRPVALLENRYRIIGRFLANTKPAFCVKAELISGGLQIDGVRHPIIKMDWLPGDTLNVYIQKKVGAPSKIKKLREDLRRMAAEMQQIGMAHGDLQHGNIIVNNELPHLVDYDGIYLPQLRGMVPNELGHKHYQHPLREQGDWGPRMDHFSLIALYVGLSAIAWEPDLWGTFDNGVNVLFKNSDFEEPEVSKLFADLSRIKFVAPMAALFREICDGRLADVPELETFISQASSALSNRYGLAKAVIDRVRNFGGRENAAAAASGQLRLAATDTASLRSNVGNEVLVCGTISEVYQSRTKYDKPYLCLNVGKYPQALFVFNIWSQALDAFDALGQEPTSWAGKSVEVSGVVGIYNNNLQMRIDDPAQIRRIG